MEIHEYFPVWKHLTKEQQNRLSYSIHERKVPKGTILHNGSEDCVGLFVVQKGQLRVYTISDEGREITLYRLFERDICLFSASCIMSSIQFDIAVSADADSVLYHIPPKIYQQLMRESAAVANYTNELMASRFSNVMWLFDQILYKRLDSRLAAFLVEEMELQQTDELKMTHEMIAQHLGSAREVISRMLKYFQNEKIVKLGRSSILILDEKKLRETASDSLRL